MYAQHNRIIRNILPFLGIIFVVFLSIGETLAVLPTYVHRHLGLGALGAGLLVSLQYVATFSARPRAGLLTDTIGPRQTVLYGLYACMAGGLFLALGSWLKDHHWPSLVCFAISRLAMGTGEGFCGTGAVMWALGTVGLSHTGIVVSFSGVATYAALAMGAPLGVQLEGSLGLPAMGLLLVAMHVGTFALAQRLPGIAVAHTEPRQSMGSIFWRVLPYGLALGLGGLGFGVIATFITLYFADRGWDGAALSLTLFGFFYVATRLALPNAVIRYGGYRVAQICFVVEAAGLAVLTWGDTPAVAHAASALIGLGFALVFPSLAVELVKIFPASVRGSALGIYNAFVDLSFFLTGPVAGVIIERYGYRTDFAVTAAAVLSALGLVSVLKRRAKNCIPQV